MKRLTTLTAVAASVAAAALASPAWGITLESCVNQVVFNVAAAPGTAGTQGTDYVLGTFFAGGGGAKGHGFRNALAFNTGHFCISAGAEPACFVSGPPAFTDAGALVDTDHNWLQGTTRPIVVDVGAANADDRAIVFNSTDHLGVQSPSGTCVTDADQALWNKVVEGIEFTVYGTNNLADALAAAGTTSVFRASAADEAGTVPGAGAGSTFEQADLEFVFEDGWEDSGNAVEGDDYASVWKFPSGTAYQYIAVFSDFTDPFVGDGFRSFDNELDAIGVFVGTPLLRKTIESGPDLDGVGGIDIAIQINQTTPTGYDFELTYIPAESDPDNVVIIDTVPAEWDVSKIDDGVVPDTNPAPKGPADTGVGLGCGEFESGLGNDSNVSLERGGKVGKQCSSSTSISWDLTPSAETQTVKVDVTTRQSPSGKLRFKPTSCGKLTINDGAQAFEANSDGTLVLVGGEPVPVGDPSNSLMLVAVDDLDGGGLVGDGSGDEDGDGLTDADEAFNVGTDPCDPDTDGDGVEDGVDLCPLQGTEVLGAVDANGCPIAP